jgi:hypothetical protein
MPYISVLHIAGLCNKVPPLGLLFGLQLLLPHFVYLVPTNDTDNNLKGRKPMLPLLLDKGIILPQDIVILNQVRC